LLETAWFDAIAKGWRVTSDVAQAIRNSKLLSSELIVRALSMLCLAGVLLTGRFAGKPEGVAKRLIATGLGQGPLLADDVRGCDDGTIDSSRYQRPARHEAQMLNCRF